MSTDIVINLDEVRDLLATAKAQCCVADKTVVPGALKGRERGAELAAISKDLLHLAHLCDKARVLVLDEYHRARGIDAAREGTS